MPTSIRPDSTFRAASTDWPRLKAFRCYEHQCPVSTELLSTFIVSARQNHSRPRNMIFSRSSLRHRIVAPLQLTSSPSQRFDFRLVLMEYQYNVTVPCSNLLLANGVISWRQSGDTHVLVTQKSFMVVKDWQRMWWHKTLLAINDK